MTNEIKTEPGCVFDARNDLDVWEELLTMLEAHGLDKLLPDWITDLKDEWETAWSENDYDCENVNPEVLDEAIEEATWLLRDTCPDYCWFGENHDWAMSWGYWLADDAIQEMKDDGVLVVNDLAEVPEDSHGKSVTIVKDHGNVTYGYMDCGEFTEVWSLV